MERPARAERKPREEGPRENTMLPNKEGEHRVCGINACKALFERRPDSLIRLYITKKTAEDFAKAVRFCVTNHLAYHMVENEDLEKITGSTHHEGICMLARAPEAVSLEDLLAALATDKGAQCLVYTEDVINPHNLGAILRVSAHYGVKAIITDPRAAKNPPAAVWRTAEGGAEHVPVVGVSNRRDALRYLKDEGFAIIGTSGYADKNLYAIEIPRKTVILFGSETLGLSNEAMKEATMMVKIPGSGHVESLNVSCAASAVLGEWYRQNSKR
jgi:TrmH RNA methyltransferase